MVNESGQLYTIEGFAAALIMILAAIFVFGSTTVYSAGDEHITDMQLEQVVNDALAMIDTPENSGSTISPLTEYIQTKENGTFHQAFMLAITNMTGAADVPISDLQYEATVFYRKNSEEVGSYTYDKSAHYGTEYYETASWTGRDHAAREPSIRASRWVYIKDFDNSKYPSSTYPGLRIDNDPQLVLLEVLIWRG
jgi:hypothetical protein